MALFPSPRRRHPFYMVEMIRSQPDFVRETLRRLADGRAASVLRGTRHLILTGCGTSFHAATYGARILQRAAGSRAVVEAVHAYDLAYGKPAPSGAAVVGVSHSGSTPTTNRALSRARRSGHRAFGVCGLSGSPMEDIVEDVFVIGSVHDRSWANTMSYTTQLVALATIAAGVAGEGWSDVSTKIPQIPVALRKAIATEDSVHRFANRVAAKRRVTFLASGWRDTRIRTSCGRVFPDFVRAWRRCSTDPDVGRNADDRVRLRAVPQKQVEVHPAAPVGDLEAVHLGLVESRRPPADLRDESRLGDQGQREEAADSSVARGDWNPVMRRDFLRCEALLVQRDEDSEGVVVEEGLPVRVVEEQVFRHEWGPRGWSPAIGGPDRSEEHTSELQSRSDLVCRLLLEKKKNSRHIETDQRYRSQYNSR